MSSDAGLLEQIIASPADDEPRLVLADVLLQRGEPRGELIAIQCLLEKLPARDPQRPALRRRERRLIAAHETRWKQELGLGERCFVTFRRGFVETLDWRSEGPVPETLWRQTPLRELAMGDCELPSHVALARLERLRLSHASMDRAWWTELAERLDSSALASLAIGHARSLEPDGLATLLSLLPSLRELDVRDLAFEYPGRRAPLADAAAEIVADAACPELRAIAVAHLSQQGVRRIVEAPWFASVESAAIESSEIEDGIFEVFGPELRRVSLDHSDVRPFASPAWLANVTELSLRYVDRRALAKLKDAPLAHLEVLRLQCMRGEGDAARDGALTARDAAALGAARFQRLRDLDVSDNRIGPKGAAALASLGLEAIDLGNNQIADAGLVAIASGPRADRLTALTLPGNGITARGIASIATSPSLRLLRLGSISDDAAAELARSALDLEELEVATTSAELSLQLAQRWGVPIEGLRRVQHERFGEGTVHETVGEKLAIVFDLHGRKVLAPGYVTDITPPPIADWLRRAR
ncbi:MAG: TIGR02996 domain-containing protein [Kofleriaceae bacterium]